MAKSVHYNKDGTTTKAVAKAADDSPLVAGFRKELKATFATGLLATRAFRMKQLCAFRDMLVSGRGELLGALKADLGKNETEGWMMEVNQLEHEVQEAIDNLDAWMRPEKVGTNVCNVPGASYVQSDPLGVCLVIGAWNYPVLLSLAPCVGAIAAGNGVVLKVPSDKYSGRTSEAIAALVGRCLDPRGIRVVRGDRRATTAVLEERWDHIFFTGGKTVGKMVAKAAAEHLCPTVLELGGKSPCVVDASADLDVSATRVCWGLFANAGQTCVRPDYLLVDAAVAEAFLAKLKARIADFFGADAKRSPDYGRLVNERAFDRVAALVEGSRARVVHGGACDRGAKYVEPTLVDFRLDRDAFEASPLMADEIFGPVVPILRYERLDDALALVKLREKPLSLYLFCEDAKVRARVQWETTSGAFVVNDVITHLGNSALPFGGVGESGMGAYHGHHSFKTFSHQKAVLYKTPYLDLPARYPPYDENKARILGALQHPRYGPDRLVALVPPALKKALAVTLGVLVVKKLAKGTTLGRESSLILDFIKGRVAARR